MQLSNVWLSSTTPCDASRMKIPMPVPVRDVVTHERVRVRRVADVDPGLVVARGHVVPVLAAGRIERGDPVAPVALGEHIRDALVDGREEEHTAEAEALTFRP